MMPPDGKLKWTIERRMAFIEFRLQWDGRINRNDVSAKFDISLNQATNDLVRYANAAPGNMRYDLSARAYVRGLGFKPQYDITGVAGYLGQLQAITEGRSNEDGSWIGQVPPFEVLATPAGEIGLETLRAVVGAIQAGEPLDVLQQTTEEVEPIWCTLMPHALVHDGERWCVRAYSTCAGGYDTVPLARIGAFRTASMLPTPDAPDVAWDSFATVEVAPNPVLTEADREAVARDYGMTAGSAVLRVRRALVPSLLAKLGITASPGEARIVLLNPDDLKAERGRT